MAGVSSGNKMIIFISSLMTMSCHDNDHHYQIHHDHNYYNHQSCWMNNHNTDEKVCYCRYWKWSETNYSDDHDNCNVIKVKIIIKSWCCDQLPSIVERTKVTVERTTMMMVVTVERAMMTMMMMIMMMMMMRWVAWHCWEDEGDSGEDDHRHWGEGKYLWRRQFNCDMIKTIIVMIIDMMMNDSLIWWLQSRWWKLWWWQFFMNKLNLKSIDDDYILMIVVDDTTCHHFSLSYVIDHTRYRSPWSWSYKIPEPKLRSLDIL